MRGALDKCGSFFRSTCWFNEYEMSLLRGYGAMLNTSRNDEHFSGAQANTAIAHFYRDVALEYQEEVVCVFMLVPRVRARGFRHHHFIAIEARNRCRLPRF